MSIEDVKDIRLLHKTVLSSRRGSSTTKNELFLLEIDREEWKIINLEYQELIRNQWRNIESIEYK